MLLARGAVRTTLIDDGDRRGYPPPAHALMRGGVLQLSRWGLLDEIVDAGTPAVKRTTLRYGDDTTVITVKPSQGVDALYAPHPDVLDPLLLREACEAGVEMRDDLWIDDLLTSNGRVVGVRAHTFDGEDVDLSARLVIGADGVRSTVARLAGAAYSRAGDHVAAMTYGYWSGLPTDGFEWVFRPNACSGFIPTNHEVVCVFASASPDRIGTGGVDVIRDVVAEGAPELADRLHTAAAPEGTQLWRGHHGYVRRSRGPGWALVGDAGNFQDPVSVHGLTDALRDAELLARAVLDGHADNRSLDAALERYEATRDGLSSPRFDVVDRIASHEWDSEEMAALQFQLSSAMANEVEVLAALDPGPVA
jgi:flavin-dependent dehydrogenase